MRFKLFSMKRKGGLGGGLRKGVSASGIDTDRRATTGEVYWNVTEASGTFELFTRPANIEDDPGTARY